MRRKLEIGFGEGIFLQAKDQFLKDFDFNKKFKNDNENNNQNIYGRNSSKVRNKTDFQAFVAHIDQSSA